MDSIIPKHHKHVNTRENTKKKIIESDSANGEKSFSGVIDIQITFRLAERANVLEFVFA